MASQHDSLSGTRTALTFFHDAMAATDASLDAPSKIMLPCTHLYSVPERFTPCKTSGCPLESWIWLPTACRPVGPCPEGGGVEPPPSAPGAPSTGDEASSAGAVAPSESVRSGGAVSDAAAPPQPTARSADASAASAPPE